MTDPLEPLKPITAQAQDEFDRRRETANVVQNKCMGCGSWFETPKLQTAFTEAFVCDCGAPMSFTVPALSTAATRLDQIDFDERFDTGMKVSEAISLAKTWWDHAGRHAMKKDGAKGHMLASSPDPANPNYVPSGVINGEPWDQLDNRERLQIVKAWHHFYIRNPQKEG